MTTEDLTRALGKPGKFQVILYIMLASNYIYVCWNNLGMAFIGAKTKHHCRVENISDIDELVPLVIKNGVKQWDGCHLYSDYNKTKKIPCPNGWTYELADREQTIVAEFDLVCGDAYKTSLATTVYFCGVILGSLVFGTLSDKFGRRPVVLFTMYSPIIIGLALFFLRYYIAFVIFRFILGFLVQALMTDKIQTFSVSAVSGGNSTYVICISYHAMGLQISSFISIVEVFAIQYRTHVGVLVGVFWSTGVMSLALIAYLIQDWKYIQLFSILACVFQIGLICFVPESFRWLLTKKRIDEAELVVKRIATFNNQPFPREMFDKVVQCNMDKETLKPQRNYTIVDIFRSSVLRKRSALLALVWFSTSLCYYALTLNVASLAGNKYLNFFISGIFELIISVACVFVLNRFGRRKPLCFYSIVAGVTCISAGILSDIAGSDSLRSFITSLALIGRISASGCFAIIFIYTAELYPTVIRNVGLGAGLFWARIGSVIAPQMLLLGKYTSTSVPYIIIGIFVLISGIICLFLPETLNVRLAETMEDAGTFYKIPHETDDNVEDYQSKLVVVDTKEGC